MYLCSPSTSSMSIPPKISSTWWLMSRHRTQISRDQSGLSFMTEILTTTLSLHMLTLSRLFLPSLFPIYPSILACETTPLWQATQWSLVESRLSAPTPNRLIQKVPGRRRRLLTTHAPERTNGNARTMLGDRVLHHLYRCLRTRRRMTASPESFTTSCLDVLSGPPASQCSHCTRCITCFYHGQSFPIRIAFLIA